MKIIDIPKNGPPIELDMKGPWWSPMTDSKGVVQAPLLCCLNGHKASIEDHTIASDGIVSPSLLCPECQWHVYGKLEGYKT